VNEFESNDREIGARKVTYCKKCIMPDTRPRIVFDEDGICNACRNAEQKETIDWEGRKNELLELVDRYRSKTGSYDCVVPWSGGKDSSAIAYKLKNEFNLNPLLVTFSPMIPNEIGNHNREALIQLGFDHLMVRANQKVQRKLAKRFFIERGNPKIAWDAGVNAVPVQVAVNFGIPLVFYAEHGESEYGGKVLSEESKKMRDFTEVIEHQIGDDPNNWVDEEISIHNLNPYLYPETEDVSKTGVTALYFAYFSRWSMLENYHFIRDKIDFKTCAKGRTDGTFTNFDSLDDKMDNLYYYMQFIKFGFGRSIRDACRMIQNGQMTREKALSLAKKYDDEFPYEYFDDVLNYLGMTRDEFDKVVDMHRNSEIWVKRKEEWTLRYPLV
jgi:N-acetyl sugar amidotransferase